MKNFSFATIKTSIFTPLSILTIFAICFCQNLSAQNVSISSSGKGKSYSYASNSNSKTSVSSSHSDSGHGSHSFHVSNGEGHSHGDGDQNGKAVKYLIRQLVKDGRIPLNQKTKFVFDNDRLKIDGKSLSDDQFEVYKKLFERKLEDTKMEYAISFSGVITDVSADNLSMSGSLSTSFTKDDD